MAYNVIDLINKSIDMEERRKKLYENIGKQQKEHSSIKIMSKVLIKNIDKTIKHYKDLNKELKNIELEEIDFWTYDKISFLINQYNKKEYEVSFDNVGDYIKFSLNLEKDMYSLLIDIQGRFVKDIKDTYTKTYEILSDIISNRVKHIETLEKILKSRS
ncbi:hypothetical protein J2Z44_002891 [Clostridium punense]|uniref:Uncharacterized protein n=1 Tax=Clostridium punense TaxID=1054297 RepID=A0ABS4K5K7_9CLOT|nr:MULTISPECIES: hypothetical protein [Clostridium]EQB89189.1 hypothetical protein M918_21420 [Clostridium sp. BL8]MBP2023066.1 hypothetical protein [Clostridium punense]